MIELSNPSLELTEEEINELEWNQLLSVHIKKSSQISVNQEKRLLKKTKKREEKKRNFEFYRLAFSHELFSQYKYGFNMNIYSPKPHYTNNQNLIMEYLPGIELDRIIKSETIDEGKLEKILFSIGQLLKIKENEGLIHGDFDLRHIFLGDGLNIIDVEGLKTNYFEEAKNENVEFIKRMKKSKYDFDFNQIEKGYESISEAIQLSKKALKKVVRDYGSISRMAILGKMGRI